MKELQHKIWLESFMLENSLIHRFQFEFSELLLQVAKFVTGSTSLHLLGTALGVKEHTRESILYDYKEINEAAYQMLLHWKKERQKQKKEECEMKKELRNALCSKYVEMNQVVVRLKDYF